MCKGDGDLEAWILVLVFFLRKIPYTQAVPQVK